MIITYESFFYTHRRLPPLFRLVHLHDFAAVRALDESTVNVLAHGEPALFRYDWSPRIYPESSASLDAQSLLS